MAVMQLKCLILWTNVDHNKLDTEFLIAICRLTGDKWKLKTLFLSIFNPNSSIVRKFLIAAYLVWFRKNCFFLPVFLPTQQFFPTQTFLLLRIRFLSLNRSFFFIFNSVYLTSSIRFSSTGV